jgi:hypothetical protein
LKQEKEDLEKQIAKKVKDVASKGHSESIVQYIEKYKGDVAAKDRAIGKLEIKVSEVREQICEVQDKIDNTRGRVTGRKTATSHLREKRLTSKLEKRRAYLFMTEPAESVAVGGGFVHRVADEVKYMNETSDKDGIKILLPETAAMPGSNRRQKNQPVSRGARTILRPLTVAGQKRRPGTAFGLYGD